MTDDLTPEEAERRAKELAHRLLNTPPAKRAAKKSSGLQAENCVPVKRHRKMAAADDVPPE